MGALFLGAITVWTIFVATLEINMSDKEVKK